METALLHFVLDVATSRLTHIAQNFGEYPLQRVITHLATTRPIGVLDSLVAVVADIKGGAVEMAGVLCGIAIATAQLHHVLLRPQHTGDNDLMKGHTFHVKTVEEGLSDVLQQHRGTWHQIGYA